MFPGIPVYIGNYNTGYGPLGQFTDDAGKIFVGGLPPEATKTSLTEYFSEYGEVQDCIVMLDNITQRSRGFAFVTFTDPSVVPLVLNGAKHTIHGKVVDAKKAVPKGPNQTAILRQMGVSSNRADRNPECKVFVGGVAQGTTESDIQSYFNSFGKVLEVKIPKDQETQRGRGFAFVLFESPEQVKSATNDRYHRLNGKMVEVKSVNPQQAKPQYSGDGAYYGNGDNRSDTSSPYSLQGARASPMGSVYPGTPSYVARSVGVPSYNQSYLASMEQLRLSSPGLYEQSPTNSTGSLSSSGGYMPSAIPMQRVEASSYPDYTNYLSTFYSYTPTETGYSIAARPAYSMSPVDLSGAYTPPSATPVPVYEQTPSAAVYGTSPTAYAPLATPPAAQPTAQYTAATPQPQPPSSTPQPSYGR